MKKAIVLFVALLCSVKIMVGQNQNAGILKQRLASAKEDTERVNVLSNLVYTYIFSYPDTAASYAKQGLQLSRSISYKQGEGTCFQGLALASNFLGDYTNALQYGLQALSIFRDLSDATQTAWTCIQIMTYYNALEDYDPALKYGYEAKYLISSLSTFKIDSNQASVASMLLSSIFRKKNQLDSALFYAKQAFTWDNDWYGAYQVMGEVYARLGRYDSARYYYREGLTIGIQQNSIVFFAGLYNDISKVFELQGSLDSSFSSTSVAINFTSS